MKLSFLLILSILATIHLSSFEWSAAADDITSVAYAEGELSFELETQNGSNYIIEMSENLNAWTEEIAFEGDGTSRLIKVSADGFKKKFIRVRTEAISVNPDGLEHPFLYLTADRKSVILENIQNEPMASIYVAVQERAFAEMVDIDVKDWDARDHGDNGEIAVMNAFLAWLNDDAEAAERALEAIDRL